MKNTIILLLCWGLFTGCHTSSSRVSATPESVAMRTEQLTLKIERIEQLAAHWPVSTPEFMKSFQTARTAWREYLQAAQRQNAFYVEQKVALNETHYRLQENLIDAFSRQWQQIEDMVSETP